MNKFKLLLLICVLLTSSYYFVADVKNAVLGVNDFVLNKLYNAYDYTKQNITKYFNQVNQIDELSTENKKLKQYKFLYDNLVIEYNNLAKAHNLKKYEFELALTRVLSYEKIGSLTKFWMSYDGIKPDITYGLIYDNNAVGIMYSNNNRAYALSLNDEKCVFSVVVGENKTPAILQGSKNSIYVNFVTDYKELNIGDLVYTSGKDLIFPEGIYVGKVVKIIDEAGYKRAILEDTKTLSPYRYVYMVSAKENSQEIKN
ncbi:rod shape-determining protein MreC [Campylobacter sp. RM9334]|uniref:rod shape-determining protein MreC n=1 Tax=unclassified Campylobacter TaxID=2593542 RepID=UPI001BDA6F3D|nr:MULTISPECIES: rod shape-determining protein MreC [unclassified Campylobacter]MBZ7975373.1 rod shape-determining protein MreC [Campylobacter sp. RM12637]MBZ7977206.1 rod shape-determining protein MreC [Campylobacter sp. RM12654]MBZ7983112.1 rod shape-determining protein MreC [Campylobacter sp. RM12647]MBZ8006802.1 rod shape-determining protein MreC [Campylobacter sp. RM9334]MBT0879061.1 rod shape-determining protein MreC [Campylobacter sp. 2018MI01]